MFFCRCVQSWQWFWGKNVQKITRERLLPCRLDVCVPNRDFAVANTVVNVVSPAAVISAKTQNSEERPVTCDQVIRRSDNTLNLSGDWIRLVPFSAQNENKHGGRQVTFWIMRKKFPRNHTYSKFSTPFGTMLSQTRHGWFDVASKSLQAVGISIEHWNYCDDQTWLKCPAAGNLGKSLQNSPVSLGISDTETENFIVEQKI